MTTTTPPDALAPEWVSLEFTPTGWVNVFADGTQLPVCAGAAPEGDNGDDPGGDVGDDGDDADAQDSGQDDDQGGEEEEEEEEVVQLSRADYEKLKSQKSKANKEAARRRRWLENAGYDPHTGKAKRSPLEDEEDDGGEGEEDDILPSSRRSKPSKNTKKTSARRREDDEEDVEDEGPDIDELEARWERKARKAAERAEARAEMKYKAPLARTAAKAALADAGWTGKNFDRVMKLIELDDVELDDDGEILGIEDQIDQIKDEFPDWFRRRSAPPARRGSGRGKRRAPSDEEEQGSTRDVGAHGQTDKKSKADWKSQLAKQAFTKK